MDPISKYQNAVISTSSDIKQLLFVFDEVIKLLYKTKKALIENDYDTKYKTLTRISEVFYILRSGLDPKSDEILNSLDRFYASTINKVLQINLKGDNPDEIEEVIKAIALVRDSFNEALSKEQVNKNPTTI